MLMLFWSLKLDTLLIVLSALSPPFLFAFFWTKYFYFPFGIFSMTFLFKKLILHISQYTSLIYHQLSLSTIVLCHVWYNNFIAIHIHFPPPGLWGSFMCILYASHHVSHSRLLFFLKADHYYLKICKYKK